MILYIAVSKLAVRVYSAYEDAPDDYRNIANEVKSLHIIINNAALHFESTTLSDNKRQEGQVVFNSAYGIRESRCTRKWEES